MRCGSTAHQGRGALWGCSLWLSSMLGGFVMVDWMGADTRQSAGVLQVHEAREHEACCECNHGRNDGILC
jgi:hypothetical protein